MSSGSGETVVVFAPKYPPDTGGAAVYFQQVVDALDETRFQPVVFAPRHPSEPRTATVDGAVIHRVFPRVGDPVYSGVRYLRRCRRLLAEYEPAVAHVHPHFPQYRFFKWLLRANSIPRVYDCRDQLFQRWYVRDGMHYLSATHDIDRILRDDVGVAATAITRSPVAATIPTPADISLDGGGHHVVFAGDLEPHKGVRDAVTAVTQLAESGEDVTLHVAGSGSLHGWVRDAASQHDAVSYHGELAHARAVGLLRASDALVLPSETEGRPRVAVEALAVGTPIVASDAGDLPGVVDDAGVIVDRTPDRVAAGVRRVLGDASYERAACRREAAADTARVRRAAVTAYQCAADRVEVGA